MLLSLIFSATMFGSPAIAQEVHIKDDMTSGQNNDTESTIEIRKKNHITSDTDYKVEDGTDDIAGDAAPLLQNARTNWKKACDDWKKEFKENNTENKIISMNCGTMKCDTQAMETTCTSTGKYKIRVKIRDSK